MIKIRLIRSFSCLIFIMLCSFLQVMGQKQPLPTDASLLQLADKYITTPINKIEKTNGEIWLQRDFSAYLHNMDTQADALSEKTDYGHEHHSDILQEFLNRPHPSVATLEKYFSGAAAEFGVPANLLRAYAQVQSNWAQVGSSMYGSWGIMGLVENEMSHQITEAAKLLKTTPEVIQNDAYTNIRAAAALLAQYQKPRGISQKAEDWFESACLLTGIKEKYLQESLAQRVYRVMEEGSKTVSIWKEIILIQPDEKISIPELPVSKSREDEIRSLGNGTPDYPNAIYNLTTCNFNSRPPGADIRYYFVHYIAVGTYEGTISWFKNCSSQVSAHYVVRNFDGQVTQMVDEANRAWSQGVTEYNDRGIGVEHEVLAANLSMWDNVHMLREAGRLASDVCIRNAIPKQRRASNGALGIYGHNDVIATNCPNLTNERWTTLLANIDEALPSVGTPTLYTVEAAPGSNQVTATWKPNNEPTLLGYRLYYATSDALTQWKLAANETTLTAGTTSVTLQPHQFVEAPAEPVFHFRLTAVVPNGSNPLVESAPTDTYSRSWNTTGPKVLIVDGFDRMSGSYKLPAHTFTTSYFKGLRNRAALTISSTANERVEDGTVSLLNYDVVVWYTGDESSADIVFTTAEKNAIIQFLNNGGKLLLSGSEIGYNVGRVGAAGYDVSFMNNYLKSNYTNDGSASFTPATGIAGTPFEGLNLPFGIVYVEDFPDAMDPVGGAIAVMEYAISPHKAAIAFKGSFGGNPNPGALIYLGFTLETSADASIGEFMGKALPYFDINPLAAPPVANPDFTTTQSGRTKRIPVLANDAGNGNTLNPASIIITDAAFHGTAQANADDTIFYTANEGYVGLDSFYYRVANTEGTFSNVAKVQVQVLSGAACSPILTEVDDQYPLRSLRGAWITSVFNLDWPTNRLATPATQQAQLISQLDLLKDAGFNTVFLQVRTGSDAFYQSPYEPWSFYLTGTEGMAPTPFWDPLAFAVQAAHERGLELHAWLNPYRARTGSYILAPNHIINTQPSWILTIGTNLVLNPGLPQVRDYIKKICADIASRYQVDGIHFDDYFYPSGITAGMQDAATYAAHNPNNIGTIEDWRRDNVNRMIGMVYDTIQQINSTTGRIIIFGVSPFGIWKSGTPPGIVGQSSFSALYCDPIAWLQQGTVDYLAPQLYWRITGAQDYNILSQWWNDQGKLYNRPIYTGHAWYKMVDANNWAASEIENQIKLNRLPVRNDVKGEIGYRTGQLVANSKGLRTALQQDLYQFKSYVPPYAGKDDICPNPPTNLRIDGDTLRWDAPAPAADGDVARKYVVYRFTNEQEANLLANDGRRVIDIVPTNRARIPVAPFERFVVTTLDKNNNESVGAISPMPDITICPGANTQLPAMVNGNTFQWQRQNGETWETLNNDAIFTGTQTATLSVTNFPVSGYGTQVRAVADGNVAGPVYTLKAGTTWTGTINTSWHNAGNWSCGLVPTIEIDAIVPGNVPQFPLVDGPGAAARGLYLRTGAKADVLPGFMLLIGNQ